MANVANKIKKDLKDLLASKTKQRIEILDLLSVKDVTIDKIDALIIKIDENLPPLFDEINDEIDKVQAAYDARITAGCRSALSWRDDGFVDYGNDDTKQYTCIKNPATRIDFGYHALKYYQYPRNRDYGSNLVGQFDGNVVGGGLTIAVTTGVVTLGEGEPLFPETTTPEYKRIKVGDDIIDALVRPQVYQAGNLPSVVSIGLTDTLSGVTTSVIGSIGVGGTILFNVGIGNSDATPVGSGIGLTGVLDPDTTVYGHGTASHTFAKHGGVGNGGNVGIVTVVTATVPTIILNRPALGTATTERFSVGIKTNVTAFTLSTTAAMDVFDGNFYAIRTGVDPDENFVVTQNPLDPVAVGVINSSNLGIGHSAVYVNGSSPYTAMPPGPFQWREVLQEPEPDAGGGAAVYSSGNQSWPCEIDIDGDVNSYVSEGDVFLTPSYQGPPPTTSDSPGPQVPGNSACNALDAAITAAEAARDAVIARNEPIIKGYVAQTRALRSIRDDHEVEAFGLLQGAAYMRQEVERLTSILSDLEGQDLPVVDM
tara:strand:- start:36 stop:1652 length:1617 start_codon:yes stop_codon:yes gene_type:complete